MSAPVDRGGRKSLVPEHDGGGVQRREIADKGARRLRTRPLRPSISSGRPTTKPAALELSMRALRSARRPWRKICGASRFPSGRRDAAARHRKGRGRWSWCRGPGPSGAAAPQALAKSVIGISAPLMRKCALGAARKWPWAEIGLCPRSAPCRRRSVWLWSSP